MRVFRICAARHAAMDGEGARLCGGRWNPAGVAVVYASSTLALAALESLVHVDSDTAPDDLVWIAVDIPDEIPIEVLHPNDLPSGWRTIPAPEALRTLGANWLRNGRSVALVVPSVLVPTESNVLMNPAHASFRSVRVEPSQPFSFDARLIPGRPGVREAPGAYVTQAQRSSRSSQSCARAKLSGAHL